MVGGGQRAVSGGGWTVDGGRRAAGGVRRAAGGGRRVAGGGDGACTDPLPEASQLSVESTGVSERWGWRLVVGDIGQAGGGT